jgi:N-acetyl sugar amidotransferase
MEYCKRCCYPANAKPDIIFDEQGVCSGCRLIESRPMIDWKERRRWLDDLLAKAKARAKAEGRIYDCIIPVSGGKDSHFQVYIIREVYGLNPLLVTYNHCFNTKVSIRNLTNLVARFGCDLLRFTSNPHSVRKISKYMLRTVGDITWHYHAGIMTFPIQAAVKYRIPLMIWGEEGFSELTGMHNQDDMVEFTKKKRQEHSMRGFEPEDILAQSNGEIEARDLAPYFYPSDEEIEAVGLRGIYLSNYISWNARKQTQLMIDQYGFETARKRDRTFNLYDKLDDLHANGTHDYLKYLKFGYGRCTDDASTEIRHGRMTREQGIDLVMQYDPVRPKDLDVYLKFVGMTEQEFLDSIKHLRDRSIWEKGADGRWCVKDHIGNHIHDPGVDAVRLPLKEPFRPFVPSPRKHYVRDEHVQEGESLNDQSEYVIL